MNSPDVAAALHAGAPDAAGQLYDAHAEALFQYCWLTLRQRPHAQAAVCEVLVQAGARVAELSDPGTLRAWLFTLARAECHRHPLPSLGDTDEPIARPEQQDAALRIMAWNSVMSLDLVERQALDLNTRHGMTAAEIGLILGLPLPGTTELLANAKTTLERALGAEILVSRDSQECPGRTEAIHGWTGTVTPAFRDRLLTHAVSCPLCAPRLPRNVSPGRIFGLLPAPALDSSVRPEVISQVGERVRAQLAESVATVAEAAAPPVPAPEPVSAAEPEPELRRDPRMEPEGRPAAAPVPVPPVPAPTDPVPADPAAPNPIVPDPAATPHAVADEVPANEAPEASSPATVSPAAPRAPQAAARPEPAASHPSPAPQQPRAARPPQSQKSRSPQKPEKRRGFRLFAGLGAALVALGVAAGLTYGSLGSNRAQLSGADSRYVPGSQSSAATGSQGPLPSPYAPSPTPRTHGRGVKSALASPAAGAGHADAVASGKAGSGKAGSGPQGATIVTHGQGPHQTVTVALRPTTRASTASANTHTQTAAQLTVSPAELDLPAGQSSGTVTLSVSGGSMSWTASASSGVSVSPAAGRISNGGTAQVTITVPRQHGSGGSGTVFIDGAQVSVSWAATAPASPSAPAGGSGGSGGAGGAQPSGQASPPARGDHHHKPDPGGSPGPVSS
ncbi:MAG: hypothetical protein JO016_13320 [Actinobacteria bacterium]|nr:hypothetical protein [Actinomycetota bacterium]